MAAHIEALEAESSSSDWSDSDGEDDQPPSNAPPLQPQASTTKRPASFPTHLIRSAPTEDEPEAEEETEQSTINKLRSVIKTLSMIELEQLRKNGVNGVPLHKALGLRRPADVNAWLTGRVPEDSLPSTSRASSSSSYAGKNGLKFKASQSAGELQPTRRRKDAPLEMSSKQRVSRARQVVPTRADQTRDPRFSSLSGTFREDLFNQSYGFIDQVRDQEIADLKQTLADDRKLRHKGNQRRSNGKGKKKLGEVERQEVMARLTRLQQDKSERSRTKVAQRIKSRINKEERVKVSKGIKRPFYLKKRDLKTAELTHQYEELRKSGKLDRFVAKRRKKTVAKDRKFIPS